MWEIVKALFCETNSGGSNCGVHKHWTHQRWRCKTKKDAIVLLWNNVLCLLFNPFAQSYTVTKIIMKSCYRCNLLGLLQALGNVIAVLSWLFSAKSEWTNRRAHSTKKAKNMAIDSLGKYLHMHFFPPPLHMGASNSRQGQVGIMQFREVWAAGHAYRLLGKVNPVGHAVCSRQGWCLQIFDQIWWILWTPRLKEHSPNVYVYQTIQYENAQNKCLGMCV